MVVRPRSTPSRALGFLALAVLVATAALGSSGSLATSRDLATAAGALLEVCPSGCSFSSIQNAIDATVAGDTVLVHDGTYTETIVFPNHTILVASLNGAVVTTIDGGGSSPVVTLGGEGTEPVLQGFTITGGVAPASAASAIACRSGYLMASVVDSVVTGNTGGSAAVDVREECDLTLMNTMVSNTTAYADAAVTLVMEGYLTLIESEISGNSGVGIRTNTPNAAELTIDQSLVSGNGGDGVQVRGTPFDIGRTSISGNLGKGLFLDNFGAVIVASGLVEFSVLDDNQTWGVDIEDGAADISDSQISANGQGGVRSSDGVAGLSRSLVVGNSGTGVFFNGKWGTVQNTVVSGNVGGGVHVANSVQPTLITNSTVVGNRTSFASGAGILVELGDAVATNTIVRGNQSGVALGDPTAQIDTIAGSTISVTYSNVEGGWSGEGNLDASPGFVDARSAAEGPTVGGDYHLLPGSPNIDVGTSVDAPADDIDGDTRPQFRGFDIGSDEFSESLFADGFETGDTSRWSLDQS